MILIQRVLFAQWAAHTLRRPVTSSLRPMQVSLGLAQVILLFVIVLLGRHVGLYLQRFVNMKDMNIFGLGANFLLKESFTNLCFCAKKIENTWLLLSCDLRICLVFDRPK